MTTYQPFVYLIGWSKLGRYYIGVRYKRGTSPSDLWTAYFTSSKLVTAVRYLHGEPDFFRTDVLANADEAVALEDALLFYLDAVDNPRYLNRCRGGQKFLSPKKRPNLSQRNREVWADPVQRAARIEAIGKAMADPEVKARNVANMKAAVNQPDVKARKGAAVSATKSQPEKRAKAAANTKAIWERPGERERRCEAMRLARERRAAAKLAAQSNSTE